jgi:hypothetical protein
MNERPIRHSGAPDDQNDLVTISAFSAVMYHISKTSKKRLRRAGGAFDFTDGTAEKIIGKSRSFIWPPLPHCKIIRHSFGNRRFSLLVETLLMMLTTSHTAALKSVTQNL